MERANEQTNQCVCIPQSKTYFLASGSDGFGEGFGVLLLRHIKAIDAKMMDVAANPPPANIINVDCLYLSCREVSVGGSSDKIVSSYIIERRIFQFIIKLLSKNYV